MPKKIFTNNKGPPSPKKKAKIMKTNYERGRADAYISVLHMLDRDGIHSSEKFLYSSGEAKRLIEVFLKSLFTKMDELERRIRVEARKNGVANQLTFRETWQQKEE